MAPKKHFLVFCAIFLTVALLLALGAWHTRTEIESRNASERNDDPEAALEPTQEPPTIQRFANPPTPGDSPEAPKRGH